MTQQVITDGQVVPTAPARIGSGLLMALALVMGIAPFATDMYLPAFPQMVDELDTTTAGVQLSLTTFLIGAGIGQLVFGPISDRVGRLRPLVIGMGLYLVASVAVALAPTIALFLVARFAQGLAGAAGMVITRAVITDLARGAEAARALSIAMLVSIVAPIAAPVVGSVLVNPVGWRGLMWIVAGLVAVGLVVVLLFVRESHPRAVRASQHRVDLASSARALLVPAYLGNMLAAVFAFTVLMAYISASPFLYQTMIGLNEVQYGLAFGVNAIALMIVSALSARLTSRFPVTTLARAGLLLNVAAIVVLAVLAISGAPAIWLAIPIVVAVGSLGLVQGNTTALALAAVPTASGLGSAILGMLQHVLAGAAAPLVNIAGPHTAIPLVITMLLASLAANLAFTATRTRRSRESVVADPRDIDSPTTPDSPTRQRDLRQAHSAP